MSAVGGVFVIIWGAEVCACVCAGQKKKKKKCKL